MIPVFLLSTERIIMLPAPPCREDRVGYATYKDSIKRQLCQELSPDQYYQKNRMSMQLLSRKYGYFLSSFPIEDKISA